MKALLKGLAARLGFRLSRNGPANRFDGMAAALGLIRAAGYAPQLVVDVGANLGQWARLARPIFPEAEFWLVEPQRACLPVLQDLPRAPRTRVYPVALTRPGTSEVQMLGGGPEGTSSGAHVASAGGIGVPATTLDALLGDRAQPGDRTLLKLDVEGHELEMLAGGSATLRVVEALLFEFQVYEIEGNGLPLFLDVAAHLQSRGFAFYDLCTLSPRPRDGRLRMGDALFVRRDSPLVADDSWR
jgi:FkbM family methyltransferase